MSDIVITAEKVGKKFCRSLQKGMLYTSSDVLRDMVGVRGQSTHLRAGEFWALKDVSFELRRGECLGLIGHNGAGKSTLLKILNGIIRPDTGKVVMKGRVGALIELGAGFHPLLTGRENVYVNGAILGMSKKEIDRKFEEIVAFSGLDEDVLDAPVKSYSSGMYARLGFAVASHCDPEILLIDEVLGVGDGRFLARCRDRISTLRKNGTALVFVSHALAMVNSISDTAVVLDHGTTVFSGPTNDALGHYTDLLSTNLDGEAPREDGDVYPCRVKDVRINRQSRMIRAAFGDELAFEMDIATTSPIVHGLLNIVFWSADGIPVASYTSRTADQTIESPVGEATISCSLPNFWLAPGKYSVVISISDQNVIANYVSDMLTTLVVDSSSRTDSRYGHWVQPISPSLSFPGAAPYHQ